MKRINALKKEIFSFYNSMTEKQKNLDYCCHWLDHISRVEQNIKMIIKSEFLEEKPEILIAAALCHDLGYGIDKKNHPTISSELCVEYLQKARFSDEEIDKIKILILSHSRKSREPVKKAEKAIYIADKLDMLGYDGVVRMFMEKSQEMGCRDEIAAAILNQSRKLVFEYFIPLGIAKSLILKRWKETKDLIEKILERKTYILVGEINDKK